MAVEMIKGERAIRALKRGAGRLNDGGGLYLVPFAWGDTHAWRLDYTISGKRRTLSLGTYPKVGLDEARYKAREAWSCIAKGGDPMQARKAAEQERQAHEKNAQRLKAGQPPIGSFEEIARRWFEVKRHQWMHSYSSKVIRRLELHAFPRLGHLPIGEITPKLVLEACRAVERNETLETAHRLREHCGRVFRFAIAEGMDLRDPCNDIRDALKQPPVKHHAAITKPDELGALLRAIDGYSGSFVVRTALRLAPLLMLRPGELRQARWDEFDLDNGLFYVPSARLKRTKREKENGEPLLVPLARQVVAMLEELFQHTGHTGILFPGEGRKGRFMSDNTLNSALRSMGYGADLVTAHGFRATARTLVVEVLNLSEAVVEMQLDHAVKDTNGRAYNRTKFIVQRVAMMQMWADYLQELKAGSERSQHDRLPVFVPVTNRLRS
ncbi:MULTISPECIES: integrase arm-type DNA-binding domain-containing protein [Ramlibacter]|uniref:Tyrosine-type recombinase/integrase n=1 Tax=Ramlibacter aquaticus TaxID=2780094 RepID=A0ABR9SI95_9BURK|nr:MULTISPECIES: integrase arm-type DNA-binding domain-containing protein [Ramlibacter]MBE7942081.1 tyrosine-type recombinase/integrase [Ramlibacter aquaticus]